VLLCLGRGGGRHEGVASGKGPRSPTSLQAGAGLAGQEGQRWEGVRILTQASCGGGAGPGAAGRRAVSNTAPPRMRCHWGGRERGSAGSWGIGRAGPTRSDRTEPHKVKVVASLGLFPCHTAIRLP
jgi:hypothetical protein